MYAYGMVMAVFPVLISETWHWEIMLYTITPHRAYISNYQTYQNYQTNSWKNRQWMESQGQKAIKIAWPGDWLGHLQRPMGNCMDNYKQLLVISRILSSFFQKMEFIFIIWIIAFKQQSISKKSSHCSLQVLVLSLWFWGGGAPTFTAPVESAPQVTDLPFSSF